MTNKRKATIYDMARFCDGHHRMGSCASCPFECHDYCKMKSCMPSKENSDLDFVNKTILEWCDNHPRKTYKDDFMEKFPKRDTHETEDWYLRLCRDLLYGIGSDDCDSNCKSCWESPMEEE